MKSVCSEKFCGQIVPKTQLEELIEIVNTFPNLIRAELANTICEVFSWKRPTGKLKNVECRQFLEDLSERGIIDLPACRQQYANGGRKRVGHTARTQGKNPIRATLGELSPIILKRVENRQQRQLWYEYVDRYHYLGYQLPYGAQLRYFFISGARDEILGCFQFSSPAWKMAPRDRWLGWSDEQREAGLQKVVNNSRFLIFPWVEVKNLASHVLSQTARRLPDDWQRSYNCRPVLMETLVDSGRFKGSCYKAANWIHLGQTTGRGRMDRENKRQGVAVKEIYVHPLVSGFRDILKGLA